MMTIVIIYHHNLQEQITRDHLSLFYTELKQQFFANNANNHVALQIPSFFAISTGSYRWQSPFHPPRNTNRVFKAFSISRNSPSDVNKRNSILDKHRRFRFHHHHHHHHHHRHHQHYQSGCQRIQFDFHPHHHHQHQHHQRSCQPLLCRDQS